MFHRVLVAGVGALGSEVVKNLGLLGCKSVLLADADVIEEKNIAKSVLLREGTLAGQSKISCCLARLRNWFPQTHWDGAAVEIADIEPERFQEADILFSCVDTDLARTEIAALSAKYELPVCDAGLGGTSTRVGRVSWFPGTRSAACFACLLSSRRRAALFSLWESEVYACWAQEADAEDTWTSTPTMASIVAGLQVELAVSAINNADAAFSVHLDLDQAPVSRTIQHHRSVECPLHVEVPDTLFPICARAECGQCGRQFSPDRRIGWLRRWGTCPACGSRELIVRESRHDQLAGTFS
ncbi:ThiF family adenylyltransferase [Edaphobacter modestus]|uniref:Adenylyltransferase/sulfurtransferase n=1 Tax=Edaphobacter modestus TaxID=388466 RepID=A0A4V2G4B9_9BACT|nr:ThiF family adenylyltransferase [Edaphobacter modestus]RZU40316.1 adenylyltransferase/sulfurtransferase [Edaphobacter modestus]